MSALALAVTEPVAGSQGEETWEKRIGKSNYWLLITQEHFGLSISWRINIVQKPPRAAKNRPPIHLVQFSPQNPLFTFEFDGQRYPLMIGKIATSRGGKIIIGGSRKVGNRQNSVLTWVADLTVAEEAGTAYIEISGRFRCPGSGKKRASVRVKAPLIGYRPSGTENSDPANNDASVAAVWIERASTAIGLIALQATGSGVEFADGALRTEIDDLDLRGRNRVQMVIALRNADSDAGAKQLMRSEAAQTVEPLLPIVTKSQISIIGAGRRGIAHLLDSKNCTPVGKERWYFRASGKFDYGPGFPFFSAEASPALLRWNRFFPNEAAELTARLTARGVAADFAVIVGVTGAEGNKGAFWDCAKGTPESLSFSTFRDTDEYGIASNARIASSLFEMFAVSHDPLYRQAALNCCHWLILKQNDKGSYDSPFISSSTGKFCGSSTNFDGTLALQPLVAAFRATGNEVFVKSAWKIAHNIKMSLLPHGIAPCLFGQVPDVNCPVALSSAICGLLDLDAEAPNDDLRKTVALLADWLALCKFDSQTHACLNYDGAYSGSLECARTALRLFAFTGNSRWFRLGYTLIKQVVADDIVTWRMADAATQLLLSFGTLLTGGSVDLARQTVAVSWSVYAPDSAASQYYDVRDADENLCDFLPLVCRETNQTLILVACEKNSEINLTKRNQISNNRIPVWDLVTGFLCGLDVPVHPLPFELGYFAVIRIDP